MTATQTGLIFAVWYPAADDIWFAGQSVESLWAEAEEWVKELSGWDNTSMDGFESGWVQPREDGLYLNGVRVYSCPTIGRAMEFVA